eukprot:Pgem_evm2s1710
MVFKCYTLAFFLFLFSLTVVVTAAPVPCVTNRRHRDCLEFLNPFQQAPNAELIQPPSVEQPEISDEQPQIENGITISVKDLGVSESAAQGRQNEIIPDTDLCPICISEFKENDLVTKTKCKHLLHDDCIKCLQETNHENRNRCPICRKKLLENCPPNAEEQRRAEALELEERMEAIALISRGLRYGIYT